MSRPASGRTILSASGLTVLGVLPPSLLGAQAVLVQRDLGVALSGIGVSVGVYFAAAALLSLLGARLLLRLSQGGRLLVAGFLTMAGGFGVALLVHGPVSLTGATAILGLGNAACQVTANAAVAVTLPPQRRGLGFGIKQSAVPVAMMFGGLAVPTMSVVLGWRSTFLITGGLGFLVMSVGVVKMCRGRGIVRQPLPHENKPGVTVTALR
ncbi:MFS transporter [Ornithinimicrobium sp. Y1847]|uniref:MFS transporter n=1 Tax=Ornithinimicrobium sp. Y1847 TaxID=3405419 RepID=UPI003B681826